MAAICQHITDFWDLWIIAFCFYLHFTLRSNFFGTGVVFYRHIAHYAIKLIFASAFLRILRLSHRPEVMLCCLQMSLYIRQRWLLSTVWPYSGPCHICRSKSSVTLEQFNEYRLVKRNTHRKLDFFWSLDVLPYGCSLCPQSTALSIIFLLSVRQHKAIRAVT